MTEIRWKNGGPLFLQPTPGSEFGLVATEQNCCCPPPPPPRCWDCLSQCAYVASITSPESLTVSAEVQSCGPYVPAGTPTVPFLFEDVFPAGSTFGGGVSRSQIGTPVNGALWGANVLHSAYGTFPVASPVEGCSPEAAFGVYAQVIFSVFCIEGRSPTPYVLRVDLFVSITIGQSGLVNLGCLPGYCDGSWSSSSTGEFDLTSSCQNAPARQCVPTASEFKVLDTPASISADGTGTSLGAYSSTQTDTCAGADYASLAASFGEAIRDQLAATFRITSRPSCQSVACSCGTSLDGVTMSLYGQVFQIVGEPEPIRTIGQQRWEFQDGAVPTITYSVWDEFFLEEQVRVVAVLFCSSAQQNPNIPADGDPAWYVITYADCFEWANNVVVAATRETWVGRFSCYEQCDRNLPLGSPSPFVFVSRVTGEEVEACEPPPPPTVVLDVEACE